MNTEIYIIANKYFYMHIIPYTMYTLWIYLGE